MLILDNLISVIFVIFARVGLVADPDLMDRVGDQMHVGECDPDLLDMGLVGDVCDPDACTVHLVSSRPGSASSSACTSSSSGGRAVSPPDYSLHRLLPKFSRPAAGLWVRRGSPGG